jgi:hypothetical protein
VDKERREHGNRRAVDERLDAQAEWLQGHEGEVAAGDNEERGERIVHSGSNATAAEAPRRRCLPQALDELCFFLQKGIGLVLKHLEPRVVFEFDDTLFAGAIAFHVGGHLFHALGGQQFSDRDRLAFVSHFFLLINVFLKSIATKKELQHGNS